MKLGTLKSQIQTLGFEEKATMEDSEYLGIINNGINRAMQMIAQEVAPVISEIEYAVDEEAVIRGQTVEYDLNNIPEYEENYLGIEKVIYKTDSEISMDELFTEEGETLYLPLKRDGVFTIRYKRRPHEVTIDSTDNDTVDMPAGVTNLIAPLAAYYIWLDDDTQKAQMYRNDYEQLKETYLGNRSSFAVERVYSME